MRGVRWWKKKYEILNNIGEKSLLMESANLLPQILGVEHLNIDAWPQISYVLTQIFGAARIASVIWAMSMWIACNELVFNVLSHPEHVGPLSQG